MRACSVCACFNAGFIGSGWAWHLRAHASLVHVDVDVGHRAHNRDVTTGGRVPRPV